MPSWSSILVARSLALWEIGAFRSARALERSIEDDFLCRSTAEQQGDVVEPGAGRFRTRNARTPEVGQMGLPRHGDGT